MSVAGAVVLYIMFSDSSVSMLVSLSAEPSLDDRTSLEKTLLGPAAGVFFFLHSCFIMMAGIHA
jgi:hypothetical protein